ncbi:nuclease A inhibitor family protein [Kribbella sp. NPDC055110]
MDEAGQRDVAGRLAAAYAAVMAGVLYPGSEADTPYEAFSAWLPADQELTGDAFRSAAGIDPGWTIRLSEATDWFDTKIAGALDPLAGNDPRAAAAYGLLERLMRASVEWPPYAVTAVGPDDGFHETPRYILGRVEGGGLAGLVARSIET